MGVTKFQWRLREELKEIIDRIIELNEARLGSQVFSDVNKSRVIKSARQSRVITHRTDSIVEDWQEFKPTEKNK